jgi:1-acyl-sn-glycerol-3-phosphate acyltransferase
LARLPVVGPAVPRSGGWLGRVLGRLVLVAMRWRVEGELPNLGKFVVIAAPHTSNWDFVVGIAAKLALALGVRWLGKDSLFAQPFSGIMRALGGIPVDRATSHNVVMSMVGEFERRDRFVLAVAPEGTRATVERWRTGFYQIALGARVPIVIVALNWQQRALQIGPPFVTTGDVDADLRELQSRVASVAGLRPKG